MPKTDPKDIVFSPQQVGRLGTEYIASRSRSEDKGIILGLASLDNIINPILGGNLVCIVARPGGGKTSFMLRWARYWAMKLWQEQRHDEVIVYITYEQHVEDLHAFHVSSEAGINLSRMARGELTEDEIRQVEHEGVRRGSVPLWFVGHSMERRKRRPFLSVENVAEALRSIENWGAEREYKVVLVFWDYLQRMPLPSHSESKTIGTDKLLNDIKDVGLSIGAPQVVGVQAKREVDNYPIQIPRLNDGMWTSGIEQTGDVILSLVRPCIYKKQGEMFGSVIVQGHTQMLVSLLKQKMGAANVARWVSFAPEYNRLDEMEEQLYKLNEEDDKIPF